MSIDTKRSLGYARDKLKKGDALMSNIDPIFPEEPRGFLARVLPPLVLMGAFGGFVALAIYAYQAGTQSVDEGDLMVVEADSSPMKEKPEDPGGMQFPNQDKTIFETFSADGTQAQPNVERVLPTPEEPIANNAPTENTTWINDKIAVKDAPASGTEQVFGDNKSPESNATKVLNVQEELGKQAVPEAAAVPSAGVGETKPVDLQPKAQVQEIKPVEVAPVEIKKPEVAEKKIVEKKPVAKPADKPKDAGGKGLVQLGAYKDEAAAKADFVKLTKKHPALTGKSPNILRADLGDKGVFYRLRVATNDAAALCKTLAANAQACMVVK